MIIIAFNLIICEQNDQIELTFDQIKFKINLIKMCVNDQIEIQKEAIDENF